MSVAYIIDDHLDTAETFALMLRGEGFNSAFFTDFTDALHAIKSGQPCLVFADYHAAPQCSMTADEFIRELRQLNPDLPVYVISGDARVKELVRDCCTGFLLKPVEISDVVSVARRHCSSRIR